MGKYRKVKHGKQNSTHAAKTARVNQRSSDGLASLGVREEKSGATSCKPGYHTPSKVGPQGADLNGCPRRVGLSPRWFKTLKFPQFEARLYLS